MPSLLYADEYFANIGTSTGSYDVTVEVEDGKVTKIYWPRGVSMNVSNAELNYEGLAKGQNSAGEDIVIEVIGYEG